MAELANLFLDKKQVKMDAPRPTVQDILTAASRDPATCDVYRLKGPQDTTGEKVELNTVIDRTLDHHPIHLRCVPKDRNVGSGMAGERLAADLSELRGMGYKVDAQERGNLTYAVFQDVELPKGVFNHTTTEMLVLVPPPYPAGAMDMFYTRPDLMLAKGTVPKQAEVMEQHLDRQWRRFSWHYNRPWNPAVDDLLTHVSFCEQRLAEAAHE